MIKRLRLHIQGRVQGVGFRPFVYNLAREHRLSGFVLNDPFGVTVEVQGRQPVLRKFIQRLKSKLPKVAHIEKIEKKIISIKHQKRFSIEHSIYAKDKFVFISPDFSICRDCVQEMFNLGDRRFGYPFINCTNCGPRYTIIKNVPYDRRKTTMRKFTMCKTCAFEYGNPRSRRFHAQPNACFSCGPRIAIANKSEFPKRYLKKQTVTILAKAAYAITQGKILAVKGIGGYHLACDAKNIKVLTVLRERKRRPTKPFALMVDTPETAAEICCLNKKERCILTGSARPILLLRIKKYQRWMQAAAPGQKFLGIILAYTPLHYLLFSYLRKMQKSPILVMTSANRRDEPLVKDEGDIFKLKGLADCFLIHNRQIHMRCDDSIARVYNNKEYILRKARGYVPDFFDFKTEGNILGCGAELKSTFSITKNNCLITSQYLGDLKNYPTRTFFLQTLAHFKRVFNFKPAIVAYDYHPGYLSTQYALSLENVVKIPVQHHHAHAASCMVENKLTEKVIGVIFDGAGFGLDKTIWGGEFFICDLRRFRRLGCFDRFGLVGADKAIEEPWRVALYILYTLYKKNLFNLDIDFIKDTRCKRLNLLINMIEKKNFIYSSSAGRIFDALASLLRLKDEISYEAEAAIALEMLALDRKKRTNIKPYLFDIKKQGGLYKIKWQPLFLEVIRDLIDNKEKSYIAFRFHKTMAWIVRDMCRKLRREHGVDKVVLSGGVFQNWLFLNLTAAALTKAGFKVYTHSRFPPGDGCISVGQVAVANAILEGKGHKV